MKISVVIKKYEKDNRSFFSASAQGKFLEEANIKRFDKEADKATYFFVKFTKDCNFAMPSVEGIYEIELADDADMWKDTRENVSSPTIWVKTNKAINATKKYDLKK